MRFDYGVLRRAVALADFTPKDQRHFEMTEIETEVRSANNRTIENQEEEKDSIEPEVEPETSQLSKVQRTVMSPAPLGTGQSLPEFIEYDVFKVSLDW
jgi:hypothetical protein